MKRRSDFKGDMSFSIYTDYRRPNELGIAVAWDRNKYVSVKFEDGIEEIKAGYIRPAYGRLTRTRLVSLPTYLGDKRPTRREVAQEVKSYRTSKTTWKVVPWDKEKPVRIFSTAQKALRAFASCNGKVTLARCVDGLSFSSHEPQVTKRVDGSLVFYMRSNQSGCDRYSLSPRHRAWLEKASKKC